MKDMFREKAKSKVYLTMLKQQHPIPSEALKEFIGCKLSVTLTQDVDITVELIDELIKELNL